MLRDEQPLTPLAGCTDVYVGLNFGTLSPRRFLNLWGLDPLRAIRMRGPTLSIGALATYTDLTRSPLVRRRLPILAAAAREVGGAQIQNRGTIGGNIVNASPAGDTLPVLAVAEAMLVLQSADRKPKSRLRRLLHRLSSDGARPRRAPHGDRDSPDRRPPVVPQGRNTRGAGHLQGRHGRRSAPIGPGSRSGSVAPTVIRLPRTEEALARDALDHDARSAAADEIAPIDDLRSTAAYRRRVVQNLLEQFWRETA